MERWGSSYLLSSIIFLVKYSEKPIQKLADHKKYLHLLNGRLERNAVLFGRKEKKQNLLILLFFLSEVLVPQEHFLRSIIRGRTTEISKSKKIVSYFFFALPYEVYFISEVSKKGGGVRSPKAFRPKRSGGSEKIILILPDDFLPSLQSHLNVTSDFEGVFKINFR